MRRQVSVTTWAAICASVALAGCSAGVEAGDGDHARSAVDTLLSLCAEGRGVEALALLSVPAQRAFLEGEDARAGCERVIGLVPRDDPDAALAAVFARSRVTGVRVAGAIAEVSVAGPRGWRSTLEAEDVGDEWVVTNARLPA